MRIFLDANVLFSAALPKSRVSTLVHIAKKHAQLLTNVYALEEARRNLEFKRLDAIPALEKLLSECEIIGAALTNVSIKLAEKDIPILGGAIAGNATHLLTGDEQDFGTLFGKTIRGVVITSPAMLGTEMVKRKWMK